MFWPKFYLVVLLVLSVGAILFDAKKTRTPPEFAINILTVAAPALLVMAYIVPDLFLYKASIAALFGITIAANWISGRMYLREMNEDAPQDEALHYWTMVIGVFIFLLPAFWYGALAYTRG